MKRTRKCANRNAPLVSHTNGEHTKDMPDHRRASLFLSINKMPPKTRAMPQHASFSSTVGVFVPRLGLSAPLPFRARGRPTTHESPDHRRSACAPSPRPFFFSLALCPALSLSRARHALAGPRSPAPLLQIPARTFPAGVFQLITVAPRWCTVAEAPLGDRRTVVFDMAETRPRIGRSKPRIRNKTKTNRMRSTRQKRPRCNPGRSRAGETGEGGRARAAIEARGRAGEGAPVPSLPHPTPPPRAPAPLRGPGARGRPPPGRAPRPPIPLPLPHPLPGLARARAEERTKGDSPRRAAGPRASRAGQEQRAGAQCSPVLARTIARVPAVATMFARQVARSAAGAARSFSTSSTAMSEVRTRPRGALAASSRELGASTRSGRERSGASLRPSGSGPVRARGPRGFPLPARPCPRARAPMFTLPFASLARAEARLPPRQEHVPPQGGACIGRNGATSEEMVAQLESRRRAGRLATVLPGEGGGGAMEHGGGGGMPRSPDRFRVGRLALPVAVLIPASRFFLLRR